MNHKPTISKSLLTEAGYKCWKQDPTDHTLRRWQKRILNDQGQTKYFVNVNETHGWRCPTPTDESDHNFWPEMQFEVDLDGKSPSIQISLVQWFNESGQWSGITIAKMEEYCEQVWKSLNGKMYESN